MRADLLQQLDILRRKRIGTAAGEIEAAEGPAVGDERDATDDLHALGPKNADDLVGVAIQLRTTSDDRLAGSDGLAGRRGVA